MIRQRSTPSRALRLMPLLGALTLLAPLLLAACGGSSTTAEKAFQASGSLTIKAYDYYFDPKSIEVPANQPITITFTNKGKVTHIAEIKGLISETTLQPGESKTFTVTPLERAYTLYDEVYVVQGMQGVFKGTGNAVAGGADATTASLLQQGEKEYRAYLVQQTTGLVDGTQKFTDAVIAGNVEQAKTLYAPARYYYESIEPVAESLGDLDPCIDAREGDVPANQWTGFHRIEKALWVDNTTNGMADLARQLLADVKSVRAAVDTVELKPTDVLDGAVGLLDEASKSKITGEEDRYSHTDFFDLIGNVDGARQAYEAYKPAVLRADATLAASIDDRFATLNTTLAGYRRGDTYVAYNDLTATDTRTIAQQIDAVGEPLSRAAALMPAA